MTPTKIRYRNFRPGFVTLSLLAIALTIGAVLMTGDKAFTAAAKGQTERSEKDVEKNFLNTVRRQPNSRVTRKEFAYQIDKDRTLGGTFAGNHSLQNTRSGNGRSIDGIDPTFNAQIEDGYTRVEVIAMQPDGKTIVGGIFPLVNGLRTPPLVRLNPDSSLDTTFNPGEAGPNGSVNSLEILSDGRIMIGGQFTSYNGISRNRIARLNADGSLDPTFDVGVGPSISPGTNNTVYDLKALSNGKVLIAGTFNQFNGYRLVE